MEEDSDGDSKCSTIVKPPESPRDQNILIATLEDEVQDTYPELVSIFQALTSDSSTTELESSESRNEQGDLEIFEDSETWTDDEILRRLGALVENAPAKPAIARKLKRKSGKKNDRK